MKEIAPSQWAARARALALLVALAGVAACAPTDEPARFGAPAQAVETSAAEDQGAAGGGSPTAESAAAPAPEDPAGGGTLAVHFLDVGQGDATLLVAPDAVMLVDAGRHDRDDLTGLLDARGVTAIDVVAITHGHADHIGQLDAVLERFDVAEVWMSGTIHTTRTFERALEAIDRSGVAYEEPRAGDATTIGSLAVEVLNPAQLTGDLHADSLALRVTYGEVAFLFTGDAEAVTEAGMLDRDPGGLTATVYQVGHHGSMTSTTPGFLAAVSPEIAVYSAGQDNPYGHPHDEVIARLRDAGAAVYGTDTHGTITVVTDGVGYEVTTQRPGTVRGPVTGASEQAGQCDAAVEVDVNRASEQDLQRIIHIGPARAREVVALRPFARVDGLVRVRGIGPARLADIKEQGVACV